MAYPNKNNNGGGGSFDLSKYETVKQRKTRLRNDHPNSVIYPMQLSGAGYSVNFVLHMALIWKDKAEMNMTPEVIAAIADLAKSVNSDNAGVIATSIALISKADSVGHSLSIAGGPKADKNAWVENSEESAVGRALDNLGYHSGSCSQEEIIKVQQNEQAQQVRVALENQINGTLMDMASRGINLQNVYQLCSQNTKPFTHLYELSVDELEKVMNILKTA
jgi:Asp-tRNA(Asn)/Glu-tRNA(Gln) amidotransferase A subunit family amidase